MMIRRDTLIEKLRARGMKIETYGAYAVLNGALLYDTAHGSFWRRGSKSGGIIQVNLSEAEKMFLIEELVNAPLTKGVGA